MRHLILLFLMSTSAWSGTNNLPVEVTGTIHLSHINKFQTALSGDFVPRDGSGNVGTSVASLGQSSYQWLKAYVASGQFSLGDIKEHHSYNGAAPIGEGWMLCDGRQITQANYDSEHGSGHWNSYVVSSPLLNKYLPNLISRYTVGASSTTQSGASAITAVGNSGNVATIPAHNHVWYKSLGSAALDNTFNASGSQVGITPVSKNVTSGLNGIVVLDGASSIDSFLGFDAYTAFGGASTPNIQPDSIQVQFYMRVIQ